MAEAHDTWQDSVKETLKPLRDRVVHGLGGTMPEPPPRGITYDQLVDLLYPMLPEYLRPTVDQAAVGDLARVSTIRRMLGTVEHQVAPTAFTVQLAEADALRCTVGGVELFCDAADAAVTPGLLSGQYEAHLTAVFERYCTSGMTVIDVGANIGYYSLLASRLVGPTGRVDRARAEFRELPPLVVLAAAERDHERPVAAGGRGHGERVGVLLDARRLQRGAGGRQ